MKTKLKFMIAFLFSTNVYALVVSPINKRISIEQTGSYSYQLPINIYVTSEQLGNVDRLFADMNYAQKRYDKCQIKLSVNELIEIKESSWLNEWESFWFAGGNQLTNWEKSFFSKNNKEQVNILLVDSLNMTMAGQGTWGVGYGQFLSDELSDESEKSFFDLHGVGNIVIGNYRAQSTLAHEIGHAAFDLQHTYDGKNLMSNFHSYEPIQFKDAVAQIPTDLEFSKEQCDESVKNGLFLQPIFLNVTTLADNIGNGIVSINGKNIEREWCVLRLLYKNNEYLIEYDYMGKTDIVGLDKFEIGAAQMISPNRMELAVNLPASDKLANAVCGGASFSGKKIIESKDEKTSEIRIEGHCAENKTQELKTMSLNCKIK